MGIVWAVAGTFVLFQVLALSFTSLLLTSPTLFGSVTLTKEITESKTCVLSEGERPMADPATSQTAALTGSWLLGLAVGRDAVARQWASGDPDVLQHSAVAIRDLAVALGAPVPALFVPRHIAEANREFVSFVERDAQGTAHALAVKYAPRACQLFKLGTVWGYSEMVRPAVPGERTVFGVEIDYYARQVGLPEPLFKPMLDRTRRDATSDEVMTQTGALTNNVTATLMGQR